MEHAIIPARTIGKNTDLEHDVTLDSREEALNTFKRACKRLLNPPLWHKLGGSLSAEFNLTAADGKEQNRLAEEGDHFRIDIPGPGSSTGDGYDWVKVEVIDDKSDALGEMEIFALRVRASSNPNKGTDDTAHFFQDTATSTFIIERNGNKVTASYHGRNETPNTKTDKTSNNIRNSMVALGAAVGLSELQWMALIKALLEDEIGG